MRRLTAVVPPGAAAAAGFGFAAAFGGLGFAAVDGSPRPGAHAIGPGFSAYADGPPPAHTGGFGEPTCYACHWDGPERPDTGQVMLRGPPQAGWEPGITYGLQVRLAAPAMEAAGFQLSARFAIGPRAGRQAGALAAVDSRVQVVVGSETGIQYAEQTRAGSESSVRTTPDADPSMTSMTWSLDWTAPRLGAAEPSVIVFHVAANAANGDESALGDRIYVDSARSTRVPPSPEAAPGPAPDAPGACGPAPAAAPRRASSAHTGSARRRGY